MTYWTLDELKDEFRESEFHLAALEAVWSEEEPVQYLAAFRAGDDPVLYQFTFDRRVPLTDNFEILREELEEYPAPVCYLS